MSTKRWYESTGADLLPAAIAKLRADADEAEAYLNKPKHVTITLDGVLAKKLVETLKWNVSIPKMLHITDRPRITLDGDEMTAIRELLYRAGVAQ